MSFLWNTFFHQPLYNALVFLVGILPGNSVGLAVIALTILVRVFLFPLFQKSIVTQVKMREIEPELRKLREKYSDKQEQAKQTLELYKKYNLNPFSGCLPVIIQLPVFLALFFVFKEGLVQNTELLYSFVHVPETSNYFFLALDLTLASYVIALLVGISQYTYSALSLPKSAPLTGNKPTFQEEFSRSMNLQMRYFFPVLFVFISANVPAAVALYWFTSNLFSIGQEILVRKHRKPITP